MGAYNQALAALNPAQREAVETIDGPVLVIAGPGTGKTQLLTTRIAHILATTDTLPQNILCLTFTESAAQTMRERLGSLIGQAAYDVGISTYHAFGSEIIRRFPEYFTEDAELRPVDDLTIDRIFREIIGRLPYGHPLKFSDMYLGDVKTLVSDAKRALLSPDDLRAVARENLAFIEKASPVVARALEGMARVDKKAVPLFAKLMDDVKGEGELATRFTEELKEALEEAAGSGKTTPITAWKNAWLAKDDVGKFVVDGTKTNQKVIAAAEVYEHYLVELAKRGLFDYDDMILRAVRALETNNDLRFSLQEQYQYLLLDEFQDTNGAQLRIVQLLTDNPVNEGRPNVLAVGDDDQAIYAFQGANYSHMLQFAQMYQGVKTIPLTQNYRSHADVLHTARGIAEQIEERLHHHFPAIEKELTAHSKALPNTAVIERREAQSDVAQFAWVTKRIQELIKNGTPPSEIAVLAPQHKYLEPLTPFLLQAGVPVRYEKRENVLDDPAITELLRMAELVLALGRGDHAAANSLWPEILSFAFWGLPTSLIWQLSWAANDEHQNWTDELLANDQLKPVALFFIRLSRLAGTETLETLMDYLIGSASLDLLEPGYDTFTSPYYRFYFDGADALRQEDGETPATFWSLLTNLVVLRAKLRAYQKDGDERLLLADLMDFVEAHRAANLKILNTSPYASSADAVQVMTAFKAKGMEFTAVFVLAVNDEAWGSRARTQGMRIGLPPNLEHIRYAGATNDERLRLFYVALTRAKSQLYLLNYTRDYTGRALTRLRYLSEDTEDVLPVEDSATQPATELAAYWQTRHQTALTHADLRALIGERLARFQLSPTHVGDFTDVANAGPEPFFMRTILRFPSAPRPEAQFGNSMHETLEWIHNDTKTKGKLPTTATILKIFEERLHQKRLAAGPQQLFLERGRSALKLYLTQRGHTITPDNVVEHNFRDEGVLLGKAHLSGKIDKLIVNRADKTVTIVDYKTGNSHKRWTREVKLHKYRQQLYLYKLLVEGSHTYAGYRVVDAYLEFIEPDEQGLIHELHLQFDETEEAQLKRLTGVVWERILTLDLPDVSAYSQDLLGIEAFEADLTN